MRLYLSSVSASPLGSSVTVPRVQPPFLRLCLGLTDSDGGSEVEFSCSPACWALLQFSELAATCPLSPAWGPAAGDSAFVAASRLCLLKFLLRSLAAFRAELFLFRDGGSLLSSSPPSPSGKDPTEESQEIQFFVFSGIVSVFPRSTLIPAEALDRLTGHLTVELEELVGDCRQDLDLTETAWGDRKVTRRLAKNKPWRCSQTKQT